MARRRMAVARYVAAIAAEEDMPRRGRRYRRPRENILRAAAAIFTRKNASIIFR